VTIDFTQPLAADGRTPFFAASNVTLAAGIGARQIGFATVIDVAIAVVESGLAAGDLTHTIATLAARVGELAVGRAGTAMLDRSS
jgi:hypothetical protein